MEALAVEVIRTLVEQPGQHRGQAFALRRVIDGTCLKLEGHRKEREGGVGDEVGAHARRSHDLMHLGIAGRSRAYPSATYQSRHRVPRLIPCPYSGAAA